MKRRHGQFVYIMLLLSAFLLSVLAGCGGSEGQNTDSPPTGTDAPAISDTGNGENPPPENSGDEVQHDPAPPEGDAVTVGSVEELLEAIGPNTGILMEPGHYNLSEYIEFVWADEGESWNDKHPYVQLSECYDGVEVTIRRADGLSIYGDNENLTEIVVEPRYAQVLNFEECHNITLSGLTMGHTETGDCSGNVLDFHDCRNINLSAMDIYGCGVYGIGCYGGTGELYVYSSTIRDCAFGALEIRDGNGRFEFHNCMLDGSEGYDHYEKSPYSELAFYECYFGHNETSYYMFLEDIYTENCTWSDTYEYPEFGYGEEEEWTVFDPETMAPCSIDIDSLKGSVWTGYALVNPESGETTVLPYEEPDGTSNYLYLDLYVDGTGAYEDSYEASEITWTYDEEDDTICIAFEDGRNYYITAWTMGGESHVWLLMSMAECMAWLY